MNGRAPAKINLALVVGPLRPDGKHEVVSVMVPLELADRIELEPASALAVEGFPEDTLVRAALAALADAARTEPAWRVRIEKRIPVAAGLGGGSSDAATALTLANATLERPVTRDRLHALAAELGADVPFFLGPGAKLARGDGSDLAPLVLETDVVVLLFLPHDVRKSSTSDVYRAFDGRAGERGFGRRAEQVLEALQNQDLTRLPKNDLASSPHSETLEQLGAFRADVTGAGPTVYGLFRGAAEAEDAERALLDLGWVWVGKGGW